MADIAIIDYHSGNLHSTFKAFEKAAKPLGKKVHIANQASDLENTSHIVLPGVGAFGDCIAGLTSHDAMLDTLTRKVINEKTPFLGICVGMQLLAKKGYEHGEHDGLGWIDAIVKPFDTNQMDDNLKIPHMGWNTIDITTPSALTQGLPHNAHAYYVHSFVMETSEDNVIAATSTHGITFPAIVSQGNIHGTQFHPEKSQELGAAIISNFLKTGV